MTTYRSLSTVELRELNAIHSRLQGGDPAGALASLDVLPPHSREHPNGLFLRSFVMQALGRRAEARQALEKALEIEPRHAGIWNSYGNLLDDLGESGPAVEALQRATELAPENNDYLINLGIIATEAGRFDVAETALGKAIRAAKARRSEVVDARLCKGPKGLVYLLTLLPQDGKVTRATVDAASGTLVEGG